MGKDTFDLGSQTADNDARGAQVGRVVSLEEAGRVIGGYRWLEHRLFELTGKLSAEIEDDAARLYLSVVSGQHAWHEELWQNHLPVVKNLDPDTFTQPSSDGIEAAITLLEHKNSCVERLAAIYRVVLPHMIVGYERHLAICNEVVDAPIMRSLRLVLRDEHEAWSAGEGVVESLLGSKDLIRAASRYCEQAEQLIRAL